jgi:phage terminase small subunit
MTVKRGLKVVHRMTRKKLTPRQEVFAQQYVLLGGTKDVATEAAVMAGCNPERAMFNAHDMLENPRVQELIFELGQAGEGCNETNLQRLREDNILTELAELAYSNVKDYVEWGPDGLVIKESGKLSRAKAKAIVSIEMTPTRFGTSAVKIKLHDKIKALELLGKYRGLFKERRVVDANVEIGWRPEFDGEAEGGSPNRGLLEASAGTVPESGDGLEALPWLGSGVGPGAEGTLVEGREVDAGELDELCVYDREEY